MGWLDFTINAIQAGEIDNLEEEVKQLKADMETAKAWIEYLNAEIKWLRDGQN